LKPKDPDVLLWGRKIYQARKSKKIASIIRSMKPPDNISHTAYIVMLNMAAVHYTELLEREEMGA
jgi:hypothetical protein